MLNHFPDEVEEGPLMSFSLSTSEARKDQSMNSNGRNDYLFLCVVYVCLYMNSFKFKIIGKLGCVGQMEMSLLTFQSTNFRY